jgi:hypothetical protein
VDRESYGSDRCSVLVLIGVFKFLFARTHDDACPVVGLVGGIGTRVCVARFSLTDNAHSQRVLPSLGEMSASVVADTQEKADSLHIQMFDGLMPGRFLATSSMINRSPTTRCGCVHAAGRFEKDVASDAIQECPCVRSITLVNKLSCLLSGSA